MPWPGLARISHQRKRRRADNWCKVLVFSPVPFNKPSLFKAWKSAEWKPISTEHTYPATGGSLFLREMELRHGPIRRLAECFEDRRDPGFIEHSVVDRTSTRIMDGNQLRLWFSAFARLLVEELRADVLRGTSPAKATIGMIRLHCFKLAARVKVSTRRILVVFGLSQPGRLPHCSCGSEQITREEAGRFTVLKAIRWMTGNWRVDEVEKMALSGTIGPDLSPKPPGSRDPSQNRTRNAVYHAGLSLLQPHGEISGLRDCGKTTKRKIDRIFGKGSSGFAESG